MLAPAIGGFIDPKDAASLLLQAGQSRPSGRMCRVGPPPQSGPMTTTELTSQIPRPPLSEQSREYHRLTRVAQRYRWWKPLMVGFVAAILYVGLVACAVILTAILGLARPGVWAPVERFFTDPAQDMRDPSTFALTLISLILMLPAVMTATRLVLGAPTVGLLSSVAGRIRWRWLRHCLGIAVVLYAAATAVDLTLQAVSGEWLAPAYVNTQALLFVGLTLLLVPLQAAAEEYVFRGYLMQTLGSWFRHPAIAIVLPVPLFTLGHEYDLLGLLNIASFALVAGWLTWRTGGLEAAIAVHVVNNVGVFALGAFGFVDLNATDSTVMDLAISVILTVGFALVVVKAADRRGIQRTRPVPSCPPGMCSADSDTRVRFTSW